MKNNFMCVISKETFGEYQVRDIQTNSSWLENPYGKDYAVVPSEMVDGIIETHGYCDITLNDEETEVVSFAARDIPQNEENAENPTTEEDLMAMAVDHEYRLTLLELGVI